MDTWKNITLFPVLSQNIKSTLKLIEHLSKNDYDLICLEYPYYMQKAYTKANKQIKDPHILFLNHSLETQKGSFIPCHIIDGFSLATRLAIRHGIALSLIDLEMPSKYSYMDKEVSITMQLPSPRKLNFSSMSEKKRFYWMKNQLNDHSKNYNKILFLCHYPSYFSLKNTLKGNEVFPYVLKEPIDMSNQKSIFKIHHFSFFRFTPEIPCYVDYIQNKIAQYPMKREPMDEFTFLKTRIKSVLYRSSSKEYFSFIHYWDRLNKYYPYSKSKLETLLKAAKRTLNRQNYIKIYKSMISYSVKEYSRKNKIIYFKDYILDPFNPLKSSKEDGEFSQWKDPFVSIYQDNSKVFELERNLGVIMKYIERKFYDDVKTPKVYSLSNPIFIFSEDYDQYPDLYFWKSSSPYLMNTLFYGRGKKEIFDEKDMGKFIGGLYFPKTLSQPPNFSSKNYKQNLVEYANSCQKNKIIPYIAHKEISRKEISLLKNNGNILYFINILSFLEKTISVFERLSILNHKRIEDLLKGSKR